MCQILLKTSICTSLYMACVIDSWLPGHPGTRIPRQMVRRRNHHLDIVPGGHSCGSWYWCFRRFRVRIPFLFVYKVQIQIWFLVGSVSCLHGLNVIQGYYFEIWQKIALFYRYLRVMRRKKVLKNCWDYSWQMLSINIERNSARIRFRNLLKGLIRLISIRIRKPACGAPSGHPYGFPPATPQPLIQEVYEFCHHIEVNKLSL